MTIKKAKAINGLDYIVTETRSGILVSAYNEDGEVVAEAEAHQLKRAIEMTVNAVYFKWKSEKMEESGWKCERCGSVRALHAHHIVFRSKGRNDRKENMQVLCINCHEDEHR